MSKITVTLRPEILRIDLLKALPLYRFFASSLINRFSSRDFDSRWYFSSFSLQFSRQFYWVPVELYHLYSRLYSSTLQRSKDNCEPFTEVEGCLINRAFIADRVSADEMSFIPPIGSPLFLSLHFFNKNQTETDQIEAESIIVRILPSENLSLRNSNLNI